jgi:AcrR family transcriptional regulator
VALRERKKLQTREDLEAAAIDLFRRRGYNGTTVEDIAEAADVSVRTFYRYFDSKEAVLFAPLGPALDRIRQAIRERDRSGTPVESFRAALREAASHMEDLSSVLRYFWQLVAADPALERAAFMSLLRWRGAIAEEFAQQAGKPFGDIDSQVLASLFHGAIYAGLAQWRENDGAGSMAEQIVEAFALSEDFEGTVTRTLGRAPGAHRWG